MPPLLHPVGDDGQRVRDAQMSSVAGQNQQYNERDCNDDSPLPVTHILTFAPSTRNSTTSSLTTATAHYKEEEGPAYNQKRPAKLPSSDDSPSPVKKKTLSNFNVHCYDEDSILSGDESDGWEYEEDRVAHFFAKQSKKEYQMDYAAMDCSHVAEVEEWMNLAKETLDAAAGNEYNPTHTALETAVVHFAYSASTIKSLKAIALELHLSGTGTKQSSSIVSMTLVMSTWRYWGRMSLCSIVWLTQRGQGTRLGSSSPPRFCHRLQG